MAADGRSVPARPGSEAESAARPGSNLRKRGAHVVSNSERAFVAEAVRQELRVDGRGLFDMRRVTLSFGRCLPLACGPQPNPLRLPAPSGLSCCSAPPTPCAVVSGLVSHSPGLL